MDETQKQFRGEKTKSALWNIPVLKKRSFYGLRRLLDDIIIIHLMTTKLDTVTKREWEKAQFAITGDVKLSDLTKFLEAECRYLKRVKAEKPLLLVQ